MEATVLALLSLQSGPTRDEEQNAYLLFGLA